MNFDATFADPTSKASKTWSRNLYNAMKEGGTWGVPRSGLIFQKQKGKLVCTIRMPQMAEMPLSAEQLKQQQDSDVKVIRESFAAIGIIVEDQSDV